MTQTNLKLNGLALVIALIATLPAMALEVTNASGLRATIHTADEINQNWLVQDDGRMILSHPECGDVELDPAAAGERELVLPSVDVVAAALAAVQSFHGELHVHVFMLPAFPAQVMSSFARRNAIYMAPAFGVQAEETLAYITTHELGHVMCWAVLDGRPARWDAYRSLRGLTVQDDPSLVAHADRNREIVAEDLRYLFGGPVATSSGSIENSRLPLPDAVPGLRNLFAGYLAGDDAASDRLRPSSVYPNPCREQARVELSLSSASRKNAGGEPVLEVFDLRGRLVRRISGGSLDNGRATVTWNGQGRDGRRQAAGMYLYRITARGEVGTGRMLLLDR